MDLFVLKLPKVELHAHLNGSLSLETLKKLDVQSAIITSELETIKDFFKLFKEIYAIIDCKSKVIMAANLTIQEFKDDGVLYLELRSTPRESDKMSMEDYVQALLDSNAVDGIVVNWILSMDRRFSLEKNIKILDLAKKYKSRGVVGIDICGDPYQGNVQEMVYLINQAKSNGLFTTVHLGEIKNDIEVQEILKVNPDRIGHGTFLSDSTNYVKSNSIPLEVCLSSNLACKIVDDIRKHHFYDFHMDDHPVILCTDDKGIFLSDLSQEYLLASRAFNLGEQDLYNLALKAVDFIFDTQKVKDDLKSRFKEFRDNYSFNN